MKMPIKDKRMEYILNELQRKASVTVAELSTALSLSEVTIRKILTEMEQGDMLRRTWGGAVSIAGSMKERTYTEKETMNVAEKRAIARAVYDLIRDGEAVFIDTGTTTIELAKLIVDGPKRNILVCTNAINIAMEMTRSQGIGVIVLGGELRHNIYSCVGQSTESSIKKMSFDKGIVTGDHFTLERGYSTPSMREADLKSTVLASSKQKIVVMDYSKFGDDSLMQIAPTSGIDILVTDCRMPDDEAKKFEGEGVKVIRAQP